MSRKRKNISQKNKSAEKKSQPNKKNTSPFSKTFSIATELLASSNKTETLKKVALQNWLGTKDIPKQPKRSLEDRLRQMREDAKKNARPLKRRPKK